MELRARVHAAVHVGDVAALGRLFFAVPSHAMAGALQSEASLASRPLTLSIGGSILRSIESERVRREDGGAAWFLVDGASNRVSHLFACAVVSSEVAFRVLAFFYGAATSTRPPLPLPRTLALGFQPALERALTMGDIRSSELLLTSPTFLDVFTPELRDRSLTAAAQALVLGAPPSRDALQLLISHGAHVDAFKLVLTASPGGDVRGIQWLVDEGVTAVGCAEIFDVVDVVDNHDQYLGEMLRVGADAHPETYGGWLKFVATGNLRVMEVLLHDMRMDVDQFTQLGSQTVLMHAIAFEREAAILQLIVDHHPDLTRTDDWGRTALLVAAYNRVPHAVRLLLERGADPNAQDSNRCTALHYACTRTPVSLDAVHALLAYGADPLRRDRNANSVMDILVLCLDPTHPAFQAVVQHLQKRGLDVNGDPLDGDVDLLRTMVARS